MPRVLADGRCRGSEEYGYHCLRWLLFDIGSEIFGEICIQVSCGTQVCLRNVNRQVAMRSASIQRGWRRSAKAFVRRAGQLHECF